MDSCKDIVELLSDYLDGDLPPDRQREFETHMRGCPPCVEFLDSMRETKSLAGSVLCDDIPEPVRRALRSFLDREVRGRKP